MLSSDSQLVGRTEPAMAASGLEQSELFSNLFRMQGNGAVERLLLSLHLVRKPSNTACHQAIFQVDREK